MKAKGNGDIRICVANLLRTWRGEVPYERLKGMDARLVDRPTEAAIPDAQADARWVLNTYEPRADIERITASQADGPSGELLITANITGEGEVSNG